MIEEKKLYPMHICRLEDNWSWGTETYGLADLGYRDSLVRDGWLAANTISEVMDTYLDRVVGDNVYEYYGRQFPLQLKTITCKGKMPLRVHPDDRLAADRYDSLGKEKFWYVLSAGADAAIWLGFAHDVDAARLFEGCADGSVETDLNAIKPKAGDCFRIMPGTVHGAKGDVTIIEVSESSALDFCLTAWGQSLGEDEFDPDQNLIEALDFIDMKAYTAPESHSHKEDMVRHLCESDLFTVNKIALSDPLHIYMEQFGCFLLYHCLYGEASFQVQIEGIADVPYRLKAGETLLIPAELPDFIITPFQQNTAVLEISVPRLEEKDEYINPDADACLPEDEEEDDCCCDGEDEECHCHHHHDGDHECHCHHHTNEDE
ncbi:MAG: hypothetical protein KBS55_02965 [Bacteroidales bacterium]|nr:hypothetical protein [Candidatus Cryptobacteroides aphodequi]